MWASSCTRNDSVKVMGSFSFRIFALVSGFREGMHSEYTESQIMQGLPQTVYKPYKPYTNRHTNRAPHLRNSYKPYKPYT